MDIVGGDFFKLSPNFTRRILAIDFNQSLQSLQPFQWFVDLNFSLNTRPYLTSLFCLFVAFLKTTKVKNTQEKQIHPPKSYKQIKNVSIVHVVI